MWPYLTKLAPLAGLGELSDPSRFLRFIVAAFEAATWCSLDPVCGDHAGRGPNPPQPRSLPCLRADPGTQLCLWQ